MWCACDRVQRMGMIQIRNVPDDLHREAKARAARMGMSLSDYLLRELEVWLDRPTPEELLARIRTRERPAGVDVAAIVREERDRR